MRLVYGKVCLLCRFVGLFGHICSALVGFVNVDLLYWGFVDTCVLYVYFVLG